MVRQSEAKARKRSGAYDERLQQSYGTPYAFVARFGLARYALITNDNAWNHNELPPFLSLDRQVCLNFHKSAQLHIQSRIS